MKKISEKKRTYNFRKRRKLIRRHKIQKERLKKRARFLHIRKVEGTYVEFKRFKVPRVVTISEEHDRAHLLNFIKNIRNEVGISRKSVLIDFSETERLVADGMLLLYAEITRLVMNFSSECKIRCILPKKIKGFKNNTLLAKRIKVTEVLKQIGLLDLLGNQAIVEPHFEDVIHWRAAHGYKVENDKTESILGVVDNLIGQKVSKRLYASISEASSNSTHHAYSGLRDDGLSIKDNSGWWLFVQVKDGTLTLLQCDLGIGIPNSLPYMNSNWVTTILLNQYSAPESESIKFATRYGSTRTGLEERGKGLRKVIKIIESLNNSSLVIHSNRGKYMHGQHVNLLRKDYRDSLLGTIIVWSVDIESNREAV